MAYVEAFSRHFTGGIEEKHEEFLMTSFLFEIRICHFQNTMEGRHRLSQLARKCIESNLLPSIPAT
jgi:hypothetical protein